MSTYMAKANEIEKNGTLSTLPASLSVVLPLRQQQSSEVSTAPSTHPVLTAANMLS